MLCVTGVHLREITNCLFGFFCMFFSFNFSLECELSECLSCCEEASPLSSVNSIMVAKCVFLQGVIFCLFSITGVCFAQKFILYQCMP